ncbi:GmrSD restriction endonuclease domain-containing protein [Actinoalloteichus fjordicus]|uniref:GmrSD restriction endonucleases N-terminal domain-containing protein n=1 Tax=Actinoalloteichus fjordicus TaxID=1612552 RepID=A0AAC9PTH4_9PSEU|nr:DUF262 domain-containing protein [Actinoalloteichus fjordicus]APU16133.1 hypothetical protein UA74_20540 [Actinoalloteichus fjordicus]
MTKLSTLLDQIDTGALLLPEFQRGYVWNRDQVRGLMLSLYRGYPVGGLLVWETEGEGTDVRGSTAGGGARLLLLDGQQRITSLYGVIRGRAPQFFEGNAQAFTDLCFHVEDEVFEFHAPSTKAGDPLWIRVTELFQKGLVPYLRRFADDQADAYLDRLNRVHQITGREFHEEKITGRDKTIDVVVDIFNRVNSGGTVLSKGDLALAKICAQWPAARQVMRQKLDQWEKAGFKFSLDWMLRNATAVASGRSVFTALDKVDPDVFRDGVEAAGNHVSTFLDAVSARLGLDHDRVLMGRGGIPVITRLLHLMGGSFADTAQRDKVLFWYVHCALWGRFAGSTETVLQQDYEVVERAGIDGLIANLERWRGGRLDVASHDFEGATTGSRFYPLLYLLTRAKGARDLGSGLELKSEMLGRLTSLQVHHIFPKALLYKAGRDRGIVNAIANFCFLTQETNLAIGKRQPSDYFAEAEQRHPGVLASQWIPEDPALWEVDRYEDFLAARRELLAESAQSFLTGLRTGARDVEHDLAPIQVVAAEENDPRAIQVRSLIDELLTAGCVEPDLDAAISDPDTGRELAVAEAYWPAGLQPGQGRPVVLELDHEAADIPRLEELGMEVFTSVDALRGFVTRRNESASGVDHIVSGPADAAMDGVEDAADFDAAIRRLYERARSEAGYHASHLLRMISEYGGVATARKILRAPAVSDGFAAMWERGRLDLTVEALIIEPGHRRWFPDVEVETARRRLEQFGYF